VLFPRFKGFVATVQGELGTVPLSTRGDGRLTLTCKLLPALRESHVKYVYDLTLCYGVPQKQQRRDEAESTVNLQSASDDDLQSVGRKSFLATPALGRKGAPSLSEVLSVGDLAAAGYDFHVDLRR
jgi:hypothetical protein